MLDEYLERLLAGGRARFYGITVGGGTALLVLTGWLWWHYSYLNPQTVFWAAVNNNLVVSGVTKHTVSGNANAKLDQYDQLSLGAHNVVKTTTLSSQQGGDQKIKVASETIGTPEASFSRYTSIETNQRTPSGQPLNFKPVVGQWSKQSTANATSGVFADAIFDAFPFANFSASQREQVMNSIKNDKVYDVDFTKVAKNRQDGRLYYGYVASIAPDKYIQLIKQVDNLMGLNQLKNLDPVKYQGAQPIKLGVKIDAIGHQFATVTYIGNSRQIDYAEWGAQIIPDIPIKTITQADLQNKLSSILNGQ
ncbi:MAG: hypothetical protein WCJ24_03115 [Candidatus Saccharibacteria bacterium]